MKNTRKVYRIEIGGEKFWIGAGLQLFRSQYMAIPIYFEDHIHVMERINVVATAYSEEFDPKVHTFAAQLIGKGA